MGFFTIEGTNDGGRSWAEEITLPAADIHHATQLLEQDVTNTASPEMAHEAMRRWARTPGSVTIIDSVRTPDVQWRFTYSEL
jgi:hypothetical protein